MDQQHRNETITVPQNNVLVSYYKSHSTNNTCTITSSRAQLQYCLTVKTTSIEPTPVFIYGVTVFKGYVVLKSQVFKW